MPLDRDFLINLFFAKDKKNERQIFQEHNKYSYLVTLKRPKKGKRKLEKKLSRTREKGSKENEKLERKTDPFKS